MTARAIFRDRPPGPERRAWIALAVFTALAALWVVLASRIHVNASWSDGAWGYLAVPLFAEPAMGDMVLFDPPAALGASVPYLKTVRGLPGMRVTVDAQRTVSVGGARLGRAKTHALDGRPLEAVAPGTVPPGHYYVHGGHRDSHDSRYGEIGLVPRARIRARAVALPDIPWLGLEGPLVGREDAGVARELAPVRLPARAAP